MKVAIIHDWLVTYAGAERVLEQMLQVYPDADLFSIVEFLEKKDRSFILDKKVNTSFIQILPFSKKIYRSYLPLMPLAIEQFDMSPYDLVISSSYAVAKGVITGPDQLHICMCYSPIRYAWDLQHQYLNETGLNKGVKGWFAKIILHKIRLWDLRTANGVDDFISISRFIGRRIMKVYRRKSIVIYPPVDISHTGIQKKKENYYITVSRMVPYKKIDLIVEAFSKMPQKKLVVIGDGPEFKKIRTYASANIELLGFQSNEVVIDYLLRAKAFIFAAEEDFGIAPLEAQACGTPVIAYGKGGVLETIIGYNVNDNNSSSVMPTGLFFYEQTTESLCNAVHDFELVDVITAENCRKNSIRFSNERFTKEFREFVNVKWKEFNIARKMTDGNIL